MDIRNDVVRRIVDFRSDLLVPPTAAVKAAVLAALDSPPEFDLRGDRYQQDLETRATSLLGKEEALLFPTCTMANQTALAVHCRPGDAAIAECDAHMITSEGGAPGSIAGVVMMGISGESGLPDIDQAERLLSAEPSVLSPRVRALLLENTHLRSGGSVLDPDGTARLSRLAQDNGIAVHIDGARLFNASIASGRALSELVAGSSSVSISLNKSIGAPFGAILAGCGDFIAEALRVRQRLGGGIRPTAIVCAAALAALESFEHIHDDHRRAIEIARAISLFPGIVGCPEPQTNIVFVTLKDGLDPADVVERLRDESILVLPYGAQKIRIVTHRGIDDEAVGYALAAIKDVLARVH
jgi:threonine aldolase